MNIDFNISYSLLSVFKESPLRFYFQYIKKAEPDTKVLKCYGLAGNALHTAMEEYINNNIDPIITLFKEWERLKISLQPGFNGQPLQMTAYQKMCHQGRRIIDELKQDGWTLQTELLINRKYKNSNVNIKGFIDVVAYKDDTVMLLDWKSNSQVKTEHKDQQLFYAYLYYCQFGKIPKEFRWHYVKINKEIIQKNLSMSDIKKQHEYIQEFIGFIHTKGDNIDNYDAGDYNNPFNEHRQACEQVVMERMNRPTHIFTILIKGNYAQLGGLNDARIIDVLKKQMSYTEKDAFFKIKNLKAKYIKQYIHSYGNDIAAAEKYAHEKTEHIGKHCLFNTNSMSFPVGQIDAVKKILNDYGQYTKTNVHIQEHDERVADTIVPLPEVVSDKVLRQYQEEAIQIFMKHKLGVLELATGAGKSFILTHIVSQMQRKTVILIDRIELLDQLHDTFTEVFDCPIGRIGDDIAELENITIATVQTLSRNDLSAEIREHLQDVTFAVVDEFHKAATTSFYDVFHKMPNAKYRLGLTGTARRTDGKEKALFGLIGEIIMSVSANELIKLGYLMKPKITFFKVPVSNSHNTKYAEDYDRSVVNNQWRNAKIKQLVDDNRDKKILILTKLVRKHGDVLREYIGDVAHITSKTPRNERKELLRHFKEQSSGVLLSTTQIASTGLDVQDLDIIINAAGNTSEITSIQSLGRVLRTSKGKEEAYYYDFIDGGKFTNRGSYKRMKQFRSEGHEVLVE